MLQIGGNHAVKITAVILVVNCQRKKTDDVITGVGCGTRWSVTGREKKRKGGLRGEMGWSGLLARGREEWARPI